MKDKKIWMIAAALIVLTAASAFASGAEEGDVDQTYGPRGNRSGFVRNGNGQASPGYGPQWGGGPFFEDGVCPVWDEEIEFDVYEGTFSMEEDLYPVLTTDEGDTYYLLPRFPIAADTMPEDGAEISVETLPSRMSPVHLMVFSAAVDGVELEADWDAIGPPPGRGGMAMGGPGGFRGMRGGPGWYGAPDDAPRRPWPYWGRNAPEAE